jgi:Pectate lyase superfamily protein
MRNSKSWLDVSRAAARHLTRVGPLALVCIFVLSLPGQSVLAQYQPIPNYVGIGAGLQFRTDINNHLSGVTPIAPRLVSLNFAQLPHEQDGQLYWCPDCQQTNPCLGSGTGALALGSGGHFSCSFGGGGGSAFPLGGDVSAAGHHITNLAVDASTGDALSRNRSTLNSLAPPATNYSMANTTLTSMAAAAAAGQPLVYGQNSAQLSSHAPASFRSFSSCNALGSQTSVTCNAPSGFVSGDLELAAVWFDGNVGGTVSAPAGWTLVGKVNSTPFMQLWIFQHAAAAGDTTFRFTVAGDTGSLLAMVVDLIGAAAVDQSAFAVNASAGNSPLTVPGITVNNPAEYILEFGGNAPSFLTTSKGTLLAHADTGGGNSTTNVWAFNAATNSTPSVTMAFGSGIGRLAGAQVGIIGSSSLTSAVSTLDAPYNEQNNIVGGQASGQPAPRISGFNLNGDFNPLAYGGDPTGTQCSDAAIQAAINAACAASTSGGSSTPRVFIPAGQYLVCNTLVDTCATQGVQLIGAGMFSSVLQNRIGNGINIGGTALLTSNSATVSSFGGASVLYQAALVGTGNSLNWNNGGNPSDLLIDLNEAAGARPLNALSQFDARLFLNTPTVTQLQVAVADDGSADVKNCSTQSDGLAGCNGAFGIFVGTDGKLHFRINVGGTWRSFTGDAVSSNTTYEAELSYDGSNIRCFQGST